MCEANWLARPKITDDRPNMYLNFYKLREFPFTITCDERYFYQSAIHSEALANMLYSVQQKKGMVLVTGEVGAGKTFVANMLAGRLGGDCLTVMMRNPPQSSKQLLRSMAVGAGMNVHANADRQSLIEELEGHLVRMHKRGRLVVLILDETQDLPSAALEELRLLWNWECEGNRLVQMVLVGQPELRKRLMEPKWEPLRQRIVLSYHLGPLSRQDTAAYVRHRIGVAAGDGCDVAFDGEAMDDIYGATSGIPRLVNVLCDNSLLVGFAKGSAVIGRAIVAEVLRDMTCWGLRAPTVATAAPAASRLTAPRGASAGQEVAYG